MLATTKIRRYCVLLVSAALCLLAAWALQPAFAAEEQLKDANDGLAFFFRVASLTALLGKNKPQPEPQKQFLVLGAGLSRTGTKSVKAALTHLGYKVLHAEDLIESGLWRDLRYAYFSDIMLDEFLRKALAMGYNATLDLPSNGMVFRYAERFPDAKILYTVRDTPESWGISFLTVTQKMRWMKSPPFSYLMDLTWLKPVAINYFFGMNYELQPCGPDEHPYLQMLPWFDCRGTRLHTETPFSDTYRQWDKRLKEAFVGANRTFNNPFLEFNAKEGWAPLVRFLKGDDYPIPNVPFPKINEAASLEKAERFGRYVCATYPFIFAVLMLIALWICETIMWALRRIARFFFRSLSTNQQKVKSL